MELSGNLVDQVKSKVSALQIDKHDLGIEAGPLIDDLENANAKLLAAIKAVHAAQLQVTANDPIREQLDLLIGEKVGIGPTSQLELDQLTDCGDARYQAKIPPGFSDASKEKNPENCNFVHDGITYQRKFGDLIVWRQLLNHCKANNKKTVLFVTSDKKDDWWWREHGKTVGPHPELIREIRRESGVDLFWMYSSDQFLEHAKKYAQAKVSDKSVADLQDVARSSQHAWLLDAYERSFNKNSQLLATERSEGSIWAHESAGRRYETVSEAAVETWLGRTQAGRVTVNDGFPDFLVNNDDTLTGYELKIVDNIDVFIKSSSLRVSLSKGMDELERGRLSGFFLIVVLGSKNLYRFYDEARRAEITTQISRILGEFPISGLILGKLNDSGEFEPVVHLFR